MPVVCCSQVSQVSEGCFEFGSSETLRCVQLQDPLHIFDNAFHLQSQITFLNILVLVLVFPWRFFPLSLDPFFELWKGPQLACQGKVCTSQKGKRCSPKAESSGLWLNKNC